MAVRYSRLGAIPQIILLFVLVLILSVGGLIWFDYLGLVDARETLAPVTGRFGGADDPGIEAADDIMLMDRLRLEKLQEAVDLREAELSEEEERLQAARAELEEVQQQLDQRAANLDEREVSLNEQRERYDNRRAVLEQNSRDLTSMRPANAVEILAGYDDQLLIDTLRVTEELAQEAGEVSLVSVWLSQLPADRASEIQRQMTLTPAD